MPDQNTHTVTNVGDAVSAEMMEKLPIGATIMDRGGDIFTFDGRRWSTAERDLVEDFDKYVDYWHPTLHSLPSGASSMGQPDLYQQARIALRDRLGIEPGERWIRFMVREVEDGASYSDAEAATLREFQDPSPTVEQPAVPEQTYNLTHALTVTITTGDVVATVRLDAGAYPGTARKTLHTIIDRIADQIGALR